MSARPAASVSRRRSARPREARRLWAAGRGRRAVTGGALISGGQLRKNPRQLLLEIAQTAGVLYSVGRSIRFLGLCELPCSPFVQRLVPPGACALGSDGFVGDDRDRRVVVRF